MSQARYPTNKTHTGLMRPLPPPQDSCQIFPPLYMHSLAQKPKQAANSRWQHAHSIKADYILHNPKAVKQTAGSMRSAPRSKLLPKLAGRHAIVSEPGMHRSPATPTIIHQLVVPSVVASDSFADTETYSDTDGTDSQLSELQRHKMNEMVCKLAPENMVYIRVPHMVGIGHAFQSIVLPMDVASISPTLQHIISHSEHFSWTTVITVVDYMQRRYLCNKKVDVSAFSPFEIIMAELLHVCAAAAYLELNELVDISAEQISNNMDSTLRNPEVATFAGLPDACIYLIFSKCSVGNVCLALESMDIPENLDACSIWTQQFEKLAKSGQSALIQHSRSIKTNELENIDNDALAIQYCTEIFLNKVLLGARNLPLSNPLWPAIRVNGGWVSRLSITLPERSEMEQIEIWRSLFTHVPRLKSLELVCKEYRECLGTMLQGAVMNCKQVSTSVVLLTSATVNEGDLYSMEPLCSIPDPRTLQSPNDPIQKYVILKSEPHLNLNSRTNRKPEQERQVVPVRCPTAPIELVVRQTDTPNINFRLEDLLHFNKQRTLIAPYLTAINLSGIVLGYTGAVGLSRCFSKSPISIAKLVLASCQITAKGVIHLVESMILYTKDDSVSEKSACKYLKELDISGNVSLKDGDSVECSKVLSSVFASDLFDQLVTVDLSRNCFTSVGLMALLEGLAKSKYIKHVGLSSIPLIETKIDQLQKFVSLNGCKSLASLTLANCNLLPRYTIQLLNHMHSNLVLLNVSGNTLNNELIVAIGELMSRSRIECLRVSGNSPSVKLNLQWQPIFYNSKSLLELDMSKQNIADPDCQMLADAFTKGRLPSLRKLDLSHNVIGECGLAKLFNVHVKTSVLVLLEGNPIPKQEWKQHRTGLTYCF